VLVTPAVTEVHPNTSNKKLSYRRHTVRRQSLRHSLEVIQGHNFGANKKPICHFPLVNNTNLHLMSHHLPDIVQY